MLNNRKNDWRPLIRLVVVSALTGYLAGPFAMPTLDWGKALRGGAEIAAGLGFIFPSVLFAGFAVVVLAAAVFLRLLLWCELRCSRLSTLVVRRVLPNSGEAPRALLELCAEAALLVIIVRVIAEIAH